MYPNMQSGATGTGADLTSSFSSMPFDHTQTQTGSTMVDNSHLLGTHAFANASTSMLNTIIDNSNNCDTNINNYTTQMQNNSHNNSSSSSSSSSSVAAAAAAAASILKPTPLHNYASYPSSFNQSLSCSQIMHNATNLSYNDSYLNYNRQMVS